MKNIKKKDLNLLILEHENLHDLEVILAVLGIDRSTKIFTNSKNHLKQSLNSNLYHIKIGVEDLKQEGYFKFPIKNGQDTSQYADQITKFANSLKKHLERYNFE